MCKAVPLDSRIKNKDVKLVYYGNFDTISICCEHMNIFRFRWWWDSGLQWSREAGQLPDWRDRWYETNARGNETAHQQCEFKEASVFCLDVYKHTGWLDQCVVAHWCAGTVFIFACFLDSRGIRHRQGWNCKPLWISACHFKIARFCQVNRNTLITDASVILHGFDNSNNF